ncbi:MAG: hypothetical protein ABW000_16190 [Actinoplanes sp.]
MIDAQEPPEEADTPARGAGRHRAQGKKRSRGISSETFVQAIPALRVMAAVWDVCQRHEASATQWVADAVAKMIDLLTS